MIQEAAAMGNWWWAASSWQHVCSCTMSHAEIFGKTSNHPGWLSPLEPRFGARLHLSKLKPPLKGKRFQTVDEIQENTTGQLMAISTKDFAECFEQWKICWKCVRFPGSLPWRGLRCHCSVYNVPCIFFNKCLYFSYYMMGRFLGRPLKISFLAVNVMAFPLNCTALIIYFSFNTF